jgi:serine/threonine-protein kinase
MPDARKLTATGVAIGTPHYMAPEQLAAQKPDPRSDIYAFGVILYQVFSGRLPFCSDDLQALIKQIVIDAPPPLVPGNGYAISRKLDRLIRDCLAKELDARPQSALDLKERLLAALDEPANLQTALAIATMTAPRRRVYWALAGSLVLALAAGIFAVWGRSGGDGKSPRAAATETATPTPVAASPAAPDHRPTPLAAAPAAAGASTDTGARAARKNPRQARAALPPPAARSASAFHPAESALQPGPPPAAPPLPPVVPGVRGLPPPSPTTPSPAPTRVAAPEVEVPKPAHPLTPSERDLITDKDTLFR